MQKACLMLSIFVNLYYANKILYKKNVSSTWFPSTSTECSLFSLAVSPVVSCCSSLVFCLPLRCCCPPSSISPFFCCFLRSSVVFKSTFSSFCMAASSSHVIPCVPFGHSLHWTRSSSFTKQSPLFLYLQIRNIIAYMMIAKRLKCFLDIIC
ncbi:unnamed protein product [Cylicocyclus nassatus]|uniref:Uncharacterized protein n=1 Tax=Cylicocyclus nassatus TaxID=53992 RepID=A0AA36DIS0_CYLNA|nr:unnamed protein product [Cylicocyclus nassatus]